MCNSKTIIAFYVRTFGICERKSGKWGKTSRSNKEHTVRACLEGRRRGGGGRGGWGRWCEMESMKIQVNKKMLMQVVYAYGWHWFHTHIYTHIYIVERICRFVWYLQGEKLPLGFLSGECFTSRKRHIDLWLSMRRTVRNYYCKCSHKFNLRRKLFSFEMTRSQKYWNSRKKKLQTKYFCRNRASVVVSYLFRI